ncbi:MAG: hypothetical protein AAGN66_00980 [Acidobacteriota bacterium]
MASDVVSVRTGVFPAFLPVLGAILLSAAFSAPVLAAPSHVRFYKTGLASMEQGDWGQVEKMMARAIAEQPEEKRFMVWRRKGYFPHYLLGLSRYHQGDCQGALAAWEESENQGAIAGRDEHAELLRLQDDCEDNGRPSEAGTSAGVGEPRKNGKERARTGQYWVEKGAEPTRRTLQVIEGAAPAGSDLEEAAQHGQGVVDVAETATDIVDVVLAPSARLEAAIDAYFSGSPAKTLELLSEIDMGDPRAEAQVHLFRAAAHFRLHILAGGDAEHRSAARRSAGSFQLEQWRDDFPTGLFDPRFVRFLRGGS